MSERENGRFRQGPARKQRYRPPVLTVHGDIRSLTLSKKGKKSDGARKPATRTNGGNA
jgi:hypothetical protein